MAEKAEVSILLIIVFKTKDYDPLKGIDNFKDYIQYIQKTDSIEIIQKDSPGSIHKIKIENEELWSVYMEIDFK